MSNYFIAYGSIMYMFGLISCGTLVWILNKIMEKEIPLGPNDIYRIQQQIIKREEKEFMRREVRMCLERHCWAK